MRSNLLGAAIALLLTLFNLSFNSTKTITNKADEVVQSTYLELEKAYQNKQDITVIDLEGNQYKNPTLTCLQEMSPNLFSENRVRISLDNHSDDNHCSTELVLYNDKVDMVGNYSLNSCSSFGWIIFTSSDCFDIDLYHDAGQEAPFGNAIKGSVDWTFTFNDKERISGTYFDGGAANMITVASPCYKNNTLTFMERNRTLEKTKRPLKYFLE